VLTVHHNAVQYLPEWCPGAGFKATGRQRAAQLNRTADLPYSFVKQQMREKKHKTSYVSQMIEDVGTDAKMEHGVSLLFAISGRAYILPSKQHQLFEIPRHYDHTHPIYTNQSLAVHKFTATSLYTGGADTTVSSLMTFFLVMSLFPDVQKRAQEELDRVVGNSRLPVSFDKPSLPYIWATVQETHRWHPVVPMAIPHMSSREDEIRGYRIPQGALLLP
jgi:hypothetical protein